MENHTRSYSELEKKIVKKFELGLKDTSFKLYPHYRYGNGERMYVHEIDLCITDDENFPIAIIEIKSHIDDYIVSKEKEILIALTKKLRTRFAVITDSDQFYIYDSSIENKGIVKQTIEEIITSLKFQGDNKHINLIEEHIRKIVKDSANEKINSLSDLINGDCIECNNNTYIFTNEDEIVGRLFSMDIRKRVVCRYTTLDTLFNMIKNNSIRMFGIAGMNDSSEVNFVEKCIYQDQEIPLNQEINKKFISSCCSTNHKDNLTFYRLYAKDGEGVCLVFDVKQNPKFMLKQVIYLNENNEILDFLKRIVFFVNEKTGGTFKFRTIHDWAHFIKQDNYSVEDEIRLLYSIQSEEEIKDWMIVNPINVITPYMEFKLDDNFPLQLKEIILGPKCPEKKINKFQIETLLKKNKKEKVTVTISKINNYR